MGEHMYTSVIQKNLSLWLSENMKNSDEWKKNEILSSMIQVVQTLVDNAQNKDEEIHAKHVKSLVWNLVDEAKEAKKGKIKLNDNPEIQEFYNSPTSKQLPNMEELIKQAAEKQAAEKEAAEKE